MAVAAANHSIGDVTLQFAAHHHSAVGRERPAWGKGIVLSKTINVDLSLLHDMLSNTDLIWSGFDRKKACKARSLFVESVGSCCIQHPDILLREAALYHQDGIHLSEWGLWLHGLSEWGLWLHGLRQTLLEWLQAW